MTQITRIFADNINNRNLRLFNNQQYKIRENLRHPRHLRSKWQKAISCQLIVAVS